MTRLIGLLAALAMIPLAGCSMKTDCEKAVDHIMMVVSGDSAVPSEQKKGLLTVKTRSIFLDQCYQAARPEEGIQCVFASTTLNQINACQAKMQNKQP